MKKKAKKLIILKTVLLTAISGRAGYNFYIHFFVSIDNANFSNNLHKLISYWDIYDIERIKSIEYFVNGVPCYFFLFIFVTLSQWILFSERLPEKWVITSFSSAILAGSLESMSRNFLFIPQYPTMELRIDFLNGFFIVGLIATIPQWLLLRRRWKTNNYYWLAINCIGWGIVGFFLEQELAISYTFGFGEVRVMIFDWIRYYRLWYIVNFCSFIPLGLGIGLFFTKSDWIMPLQTGSAQPIARCG